MEAAGIEREDPILQRVLLHELTNLSTEVSALCLHGSGIRCHLLADNDPILEHIAKLWLTIRKPAREAVYALVKEAAQEQP